MKSTNEQKPAGKVKGAPVEEEKEFKKVRKPVVLNRAPETLFTVSGSRAFEELRKGKDAKVMKKAFEKLSEEIISEMKSGLESNMGCVLLSTLYKNEFGLIRSRLEAVKTKFDALIEQLNGEEIVGLCNANGITVDVGALNKIIADIDAMNAYFTKGAASLAELLKIKAQDVLNNKTIIAHYEELVVKMTEALPLAKELSDVIRTVRNLQEAQSLYLDVAKEGEINGVLTAALKNVQNFFGKFGLPVWTEEDEKGGGKLSAVRLYFGDFNEAYEKLAPSLEALRNYAENFNTDCLERRNQDVSMLKALTDRVSPAVPHVSGKVYELVLGTEAPKIEYLRRTVEREAMNCEKLATLNLADVLQAYANGGLNDALFSLSALRGLGLITEDAERVLIVDSGYPMREDWENLLNKYLLIGKDQSVYITENVLSLITPKKEKE